MNGQLTSGILSFSLAEALCSLAWPERVALLLRDVEKTSRAAVAKRAGLLKENGAHVDWKSPSRPPESHDNSKVCSHRVLSPEGPLLSSETVPEPEARPSQEPGPGGFQIEAWGATVRRIREGDSAAIEQLYETFKAGLKFFLLRNLGPADVDDRIHDCLVIVVEAIQKDHLRDPEGLPGFIRTVLKRQTGAHIRTKVENRRSKVDFDESMYWISDRQDDPEKQLRQQRTEIARKAMKEISRRDREILQRFYVREQSLEQICRDMDLTYNQFRLLKWRAKARFGEVGKRLASRAARRCLK